MEDKILIPNGGFPMHTFQELEENYFPYITNKNDRALIKKAYEFAKEKHSLQFRKSGEPYIHHLIEVAYILTNLKTGPQAICAGLLHDVVEDTDVSVDDIKSLFGEDVALLVESLTKIQRLKLSHREKEDFEAEDHRKIFIGMAKDIRVIIIKLADRLHNMRTLDYLTKDRQLALSKETLEVFAPIAHRLGMFAIKSELEDLSLKYLHPEDYNEISSLLEKKSKNRAKALEQLKKRIADIIFKAGISFEIEARVKSIYSIYKKIHVKGYEFDDIYDLLALRVITETEINCYEILGLIHAVFTPVPGRFKDYIAMPKPNMYQSLHTCIVSGGGNVFEIQIRTRKMDEIAETGVAAHWRYKEGSNYNAKEEQREIEEKLHWFREFVSLGEDSFSSSAKEYMENVSKDIFEANVYVFTPMGKVIDLPSGSTPVDFAYRVHTRVGDSCVGALVNNVMVPLDKTLETGDIVEIKTSKASNGPSEGWLKFVRTSLAKNSIKKFIQKRDAELLKDERVAKGKQTLVDIFKERGFSEQEMLNLVNTNKVLNYFNVDNISQLYLLLVTRNIVPSAIIDFLNLKKKTVIALNKVEDRKDDDVPVFVPNAGKIAISLANCCTPIPGDEIVGYISQGRGISVHRKNCPNIKNEKKRLVNVYWRDDIKEKSYPVDINVESQDRPNLIVDVMSCMQQQKVAVSSLNAKLHIQTMQTTISLTIYVENINKLQDVFNTLLNVKGVFDVQRVIH